MATYLHGTTSPGEHVLDLDALKSDTVALTAPTRGIYVGVAGDVKLITVGGETITFTNVPAGLVVPVCARLVFDTLTTATGLIGIY